MRTSILAASSLVLLAACGAAPKGGEAPSEEVTPLGDDAAVKESANEHCDGEDNDGDGAVDEGCTHCQYIVTRARSFWTSNTCVLTGGGTGFSLLPVTIGTTTYSTTSAVTTYLGTPAGTSAVIKLGQQLMIAKFNRSAFFLGSDTYHDWNGDGTDETVDQLIATADTLMTRGSAAQKNAMATVLQSLNADGTSFPLWFDSTCARPPEICNGVDDDADGSVDEDCGCYEVCDGVDNNADGAVDPGCNHAPTITSVSISPGTLYTNTDATVTAAGADADGNPLTWRYQWYVDGAAVSGATTSSFAATNFNKGQTVRVDAWVSDGTVEVGPTSSSTLTVANTAPTAPGVALTDVAESTGLSGLQCGLAAAATDVDGDPLTYAYAWSFDGTAFTDTSTVSATGDYVNNRDLGRGSDWTCTVTVSDGSATATGTSTESFSGPAQAGYAFETLANIDFPSDMVVAPDGNLLISDLLGGVHYVDPTTGEELAVANPVGSDVELLAIQLHPQFGDGAHDWIYLWASRWGDLYRAHVSLDPFAITDVTLVMDLDATNSDGHCGGGLQFWDGETGESLLYVGTGPLNGADAQDGDNPGKKILALSVDPSTGDVMGAGLDPTATDDRVAAYGTRNPWRITDCGAALCFGDPGVSSYEEVNAYSSAGQNFGHPDQEGPETSPYEPAVAYWGDDEDTYTNADIQGFGGETFADVPFVSQRFSGAAYGGRLDGYIFFSDFYDGWVRAIRIDDTGAPSGDSIPVAHQTHLMKMVEGVDGTIYAIDLGGSLSQLVLRADRATVGPVGEALSSTNYATATSWSPRYALWSNGADKDRRIAIPSGTHIDNVTDPNHWSFPDGTRVYKTFALGGANIETRVLEKDGDRWIPGVYLWNSTGTDAYLSDGYSSSASATTSSGYHYQVPATELCAECHQSERGSEWPLGLTPFRLGNSALSTLTPLLQATPAAAPEASGSSATKRVRGYLDANCSFCHNPDGVVSQVTVIGFDLSYDATIDTSVVAQYYHANPNLDDGDPIFWVSNPRNSVLYQVIRNTEMPIIGVNEYDRSMLTPIATWISGL